MMGPMTTIVFCHAHPDDEASLSSGSMARAAAQGDRVVLVFATDGEHGEVPEDLRPGETLATRRRREASASADVLGVARLAWLGYRDSGMRGWAQNEHEQAFVAAPLDEAAARLANILDEERADVLVGYDWHGGYGHPDHVQVHRVAHRAAQLAQRRPVLLEVTMNRDAMRRMAQSARDAGVPDFDPDAPMDDGNPLGTPEAELSWEVDVAAYVDRKRAALACHASQVTDIGGFLAVPAEQFAAAFGREYYVQVGVAPGMRRGWPFGAASAGG